jgi:hypothetical protein
MLSPTLPLRRQKPGRLTFHESSPMPKAHICLIRSMRVIALHILPTAHRA